jgi:hypothetical protein
MGAAGVLICLAGGCVSFGLLIKPGNFLAGTVSAITCLFTFELLIAGVCLMGSVLRIPGVCATVPLQKNSTVIKKSNFFRIKILIIQITDSLPVTIRIGPLYILQLS